MAEYDLAKTEVSNLDNVVDEYRVSSETTDGVAEVGKTFWDNKYWPEYYGYYKKIPELKKAIDAFATWVLGKGWTADSRTTAILENMTGWGEDSFQSIMWNLIVTMKVNGDSYAEIIRNEDSGTLLNLKVLDPRTMRTIVNDKGVIQGYEQYSKTGDKAKTSKFKVNEILHLVNDRIADNIHGTSVIEACKWVIDARNEAMSDWRRISHRSTIRVMYVDADDTTKLKQVKADYADAINKGELLIIPGKRADADLGDLTPPPVDNFLSWIRYLENFFYQAVGIPKVILGGSEEFTEASSKISYLTYEQIYTKEIVNLEADIWNQLALRVTFNKPASIRNELLQSEGKNTGQTSIQPNETQVGLQRSE